MLRFTLLPQYETAHAYYLYFDISHYCSTPQSITWSTVDLQLCKSAYSLEISLPYTSWFCHLLTEHFI